MDTIAQRLRFAREAIGLGQAEGASKFGIPISTYRKYESGPSEPGADAVAGISRAGINANWLLTGEGPMLLSELITDALNDFVDAESLKKTADTMRRTQAVPQAQEIDVPLLVKLIEEMERAASQTSVAIPAKDKGEMIARSYADITVAMSHHESRLDAARVAGGFFERIAALYKGGK